jgi:hypothetical protein
MSEIPACPKCGGTKFLNIPDSLGQACMTKGCLFVWAGYDDEWEPAAPLNEWFAPSKKHATHAAVEGGEGER